MPTGRAKRIPFLDAEPMQLVPRIQTEPGQRLALWAGHYTAGIKLLGQTHVRAQLGDHRNVQAFSDLALLLQIDISHVPNHDVRLPLQSLFTIPQAWLQEERVATMSRGHPRDQRDQKYFLVTLAQPYAQCVLFISHKPATLAGL